MKATALRLVDEVEVLEGGLEDDRRFYFITEAGRLLNNKDCGPLQLVQSDYDGQSDVLTLRLPDGSVVTDSVDRADELETRFHSRVRLARLVRGPWSGAVQSLVGQPVRLVEPGGGATDRGRAGPATARNGLVAVPPAASLGADPVHERRFRMNFGVDGLDAHGEDGWLGRRVAIGAAVVVPRGNVGRCVVTTQSPETGQTDLDTLKALAAYRGSLETTEPLPFGTHAAVVQPGRVRLGDPVHTL